MSRCNDTIHSAVWVKLLIDILIYFIDSLIWYPLYELSNKLFIDSQVAQSSNMSIGEHRHSKYKDLYAKKTYRFCNLRKWKDFNKKQLTLLKMCVTSLLCGPRADLWPFYGFLCKLFSLYIEFYNFEFSFQPRSKWLVKRIVSYFFIQKCL